MLSHVFKQMFPESEFPDTDYFMVSDSPLGPFRTHGTGQIMPEHPSCRFYASQLLRLDGELFILGTTRQDSGLTGISDPIKVFKTRID